MLEKWGTDDGTQVGHHVLETLKLVSYKQMKRIHVPELHDRYVWHDKHIYIYMGSDLSKYAKIWFINYKASL